MSQPSTKKVLIITYYWPPSGGSGVQRWLKFVKYLQREGWEPIVFTPENPSFTTQDPSLQRDIPASVEVLKLPIWEPYKLFESLSGFFGKKKISQTDFIQTEKKSTFQGISSWIRGNLFVPDARIFWVRPATSFLGELIKSNGIDKIITTGPPHSIHLIGLRLKKKNPSLKWVADFRDPWSRWDLLDTLSLSRFARWQHERLERDVLRTADRVVTIAPYHVKLFQQLGGRPVDLITNGFDEDDFGILQRVENEKFTVRHVGVVDELRDPRSALLAIRNVVVRENIADRVCVEFIGHVNSAFKNWVAQDALLSGLVNFVPYLPHHELLKTYGSTELQLLVLAHTSIAPGNLPGKFFEYLASRNPILAVGPSQGDAAEVLRETQAGEIFEHTDVVGMEEFISKKIQQWKEKTRIDPPGVSRYSRKALTQQLISLLNEL